MPLVFRSLHQRKEASFGQDFLCLLEHELILRLLGVLYALTVCVDGVSAQLERQFAIDGVRKSASLNLAQDYLKIEAGVLCHLQEFHGFYLLLWPKGKPCTSHIGGLRQGL